MDPELIEYFNEIDSMLSTKEEPVDIFLVSDKFNITIQQSKYLLNNFITQEELLKQYNVIFSADILEGEKVKTLIIPSFSHKLREVLQLKEDLLNFGVFAIYRIEQVNLLNDYSVFCQSNKIIREIEVIKKVEDKQDFRNPYSVKKPIVTGVTSNMVPNKVVNNAPMFGRTTANISGANSIFSKMCSNKLSMMKNDTIDEKSSKETLDHTTEINNEFSSNIDDTIGGFGSLKRKNINDEESKLTKTKLDTTKLSNLTSLAEINTNDPYNASYDIAVEGEMIDSNGRRKIKKVRRIKKTYHTRDENGCLKTVEEWMDEEYWTEDIYSVKPARREPVTKSNEAKKKAKIEQAKEQKKTKEKEKEKVKVKVKEEEKEKDKDKSKEKNKDKSKDKESKNKNKGGRKPAKKKNPQQSLFSFMIK
jgi:hypothetical protein